ncbi:MAG: hypothetical protein JWM68_4903 [Verrucomicrobiales bacterium]|nr:hypothetical protein [Verrucomicrobiales bacterium]
MNKALGIALLVVGVILLVLGYNESQSFSSGVSRVFNNSPTDRSIWFLVGGGIAAAVGLFLTVTKSR